MDKVRETMQIKRCENKQYLHYDPISMTFYKRQIYKWKESGQELLTNKSEENDNDNDFNDSSLLIE